MEEGKKHFKKKKSELWARAQSVSGEQTQVSAANVTADVGDTPVHNPVLQTLQIPSGWEQQISPISCLESYHSKRFLGDGVVHVGGY